MAAVSALTFSFCPSSVTHIDGMTGTTPALYTLLDLAAIDSGHGADVAKIDRFAVSVGQLMRSPNSTFVVRKFSGRAWPPSSSMRRARYSLTSPASTRSTMASVSSSV